MRSGLPSSNQGLFLAKPRHGHVVGSLWVHPPSSPCPTFSANIEPISGADLGGGFVGFERTPHFADSFDLLVLCYSQQCSTLSTGVATV